MKNISKIIAAFMVVLFAVSGNAQTACCSANAGKSKTICCPGGLVTLNGSGTCNCTDTIIVSGDTTILHCNTLLYSWKPTASLNNPNIAQPIAHPSVTTTYTLTTYCYDTLNHDTCCQASSTVTVTVNSTCCRLGASDTNSPGISMYPNPASGTVNLRIGDQAEGNEVLIYDNTGRLVLSQELPASGTVFSIDVSGIAKGAYLLQVKNGAALLYSNSLLIE